MKASHLGWVVCVAALAAPWGCGDRSPPGTASSSSSASAAAPDALCEHGVLAAACPKCNPKLEAVYRAKGDWCGEHGFPESFCPICHPEQGGRPKPVDAAAKSKAKEADAKSKEPADGTKVKLKTKAILEGMGLATSRATASTAGAKLTVPARLTYDGTKTAEINARSPGVVRKLLVDIGAHVKKGDALVVVESAGVGADRARLTGAQKRLAIAEQHLSRFQELEEARCGLAT